MLCCCKLLLCKWAYGNALIQAIDVGECSELLVYHNMVQRGFCEWEVRVDEQVNFIGTIDAELHMIRKKHAFSCAL